MKSAFALIMTCAMFSLYCGSTISQNCGPDEFECDNGTTCIPRHEVCDTEEDCWDGSDEPGDPDLCPACRSDEFRCENGYCLEDEYVCDYYNDCGDGSDERQDCPPCHDGDFQCSNQVCLTRDYICDGYNDCGDWSDEGEETCPCSQDDIRCPLEQEPGTGLPGICIPKDHWCDAEGIWDCPNGADELNCTLAMASARRVVIH